MQPLCHGASVDNGHLRGPVILTHIAECFHFLFLRLWAVAAGIGTPNLPLACGANALTHCAIAAD